MEPSSEVYGRALEHAHLDGRQHCLRQGNVPFHEPLGHQRHREFSVESDEHFGRDHRNIQLSEDEHYLVALRQRPQLRWFGRWGDEQLVARGTVVLPEFHKLVANPRTAYQRRYELRR